MRVLLDECAPKRLGSLIAGHDVSTVPDAGWAGIANGELLKVAADRFDVLVTVDHNLAFQQNVSSLSIPVIVLKSTSSKLDDLALLIPQLLELLDSPLSRTIYAISHDSPVSTDRG